jgi:outer membrane protein TolC
MTERLAMNEFPSDRWVQRLRIASLCTLILASLQSVALGDPPPNATAQEPQTLTLEGAVRWALESNPDLAVQRTQRGFAAAGVIVAATYPYNPLLELRNQHADGPLSSGLTSRLAMEHLLLFQVEVRGQSMIRRQGAAAAATRTDWEIAQLEQTLSGRVIHAFTTVVYWQEKSRVFDETLRFNEELAAHVRKLMDAGQLQGADLLLAQAEVDASRDQAASGKESLVAARQDLFRVLGVVDASFQVQGSLDVPPLPIDAQTLEEKALELRGDVRARQAAISEANANVRLAVANRYGNPTMGPVYTYDPSRINSIGLQLNIPLPIANTNRGVIAQREAERSKAVLSLQQAETSVRQDVRSAIARMQAAQTRADNYRERILPGLRKGEEGMRNLFGAAAPGVDVLRVIDVRRKYLMARSSYVDALWRLSLARADLFTAVGLLDLTEYGPGPTTAPTAPAAPAPNSVKKGATPP